MTSDRTLITGGLGFIGSEMTRRLVAAGHRPVVVDIETYAGDRGRVSGVANNVEIHSVDITDEAFRHLVREAAPRTIIHMAAESHVTRSEKDPDRFFKTNVEGTEKVLQAARDNDVELVIHVSTDEVYGPCTGDPFRETEKQPGEGLATSAYARSKALADDLALSFADEVPLIVVRPTNCFGPWQHPEKAVARWTVRAIEGKSVPVWGDGLQVRDWLSVGDACSAIETLIDLGTPGEIHNIAPEIEQVTNLEMAIMVAGAAGCSPDAIVLTKYDRPDHDRRYAIDARKLRAHGWRPSVTLPQAIAATVSWYENNRGWWEPLVPGAEELYDDVQG